MTLGFVAQNIPTSPMAHLPALIIDSLTHGPWDWAVATARSSWSR